MNAKLLAALALWTAGPWMPAPHAAGPDGAGPANVLAALPWWTGGAARRDDADAGGRAAMPEWNGATGWINTPPLTRADLRGKVVLVEFWTYTCINWRREYAYVRAWAEKYAPQGLVVIGVHTPEFGFERDIDNVRRAVDAIGVRHPVAVDSRMAIWNAYGNAYWPALYFIDATGRIRHQHFGEGDYDASERMLQRLLTEAGRTGVRQDLVVPAATGAEAAPDWAQLASPENYIGYARTEGLAAKPVRDRAHDYAAPAELQRNQWSPAGAWTLRADSAQAAQSGSRIVYRFHARDLHLVMGPSTPGARVRFRVTIDGQPPGDAHGVDVDAQGAGMLDAPRMYQLIRQSGSVRDRRFEIEFLDPGAEVYSFTFG